MKLGDAADKCVHQSSVHRHAQHAQLKPGREVEFNEFYFYAQAALKPKTRLQTWQNQQELL